MSTYIKWKIELSCHVFFRTLTSYSGCIFCKENPKISSQLKSHHDSLVPENTYLMSPPWVGIMEFKSVR